MADATITIDKATWEEYSEATRRALIDHELTHLLLVAYPNSSVAKRDDHDRPKLKIRPHDFELGIFKSVIERHGEDSPDFLAVQHVNQGLRQMDFAFG